MNQTDIQFILASQSPRRRELLARYGFRFTVRPADIDETPRAGEGAETYVARLARDKAGAVAESTGRPVLAADTVVAIDGQLLGKPADEADAVAMLTRLSGRRHTVLTGVCVMQGRRSESVLAGATIEFAKISPALARAYWASGEPRGKAGAYGIQGLGEAFVRRIEGNYSAVVGLPLQPTLTLLQLFAIQAPVFAGA